MKKILATAALSLTFIGGASAQVEHPPSETSLAFDNLTAVLTEGLAEGGLTNVLAPGGQALSGFVQTAVTDTADSINPTGGLDLLNDLGGFAAEQDTPTEAPAGTLPGL